MQTKLTQQIGRARRVKPVRTKRNQFTNTSPPSNPAPDGEYRVSGIKYNGNPLSCMA